MIFIDDFLLLKKEAELQRLWKRGSYFQDNKIFDEVIAIINNIKSRGLEAVKEYSKKFDDYDLSLGLIASEEEIISQARLVPTDVYNALKHSAERIKRYHESVKIESFKYETEESESGFKWTPIENVGIYIPGGLAAYPSTILMTVIVADVAGVNNIYVCSKPNKGKINPYIASAILACNTKKVKVVKLSGIQAISSMALGLGIKKVDKIFGPGNDYVSLAKKYFFGEVAIDMMAGPSEILIVSDGKVNPSWIAWDFLSQAEHDKNAKTGLISNEIDFLNEVMERVKEYSLRVLNKHIVESSLQNSFFGFAPTLEDAISISNILAPEHLEIACENPEELFNKVQNAGTVFLGNLTCEPFGDYILGPSHVLPTSGSARYFSGINVYDFLKRTNFSRIKTKNALKNLLDASLIAEVEGFSAHKKSMLCRNE
ncbi:Histidinol dehydrogenase [Thermodesulfobium narugense DSM 14796]|uniref:Histidinol dehydrogenase n=1 Tax=Thermodesulfobium narugense DSM 14796 TaxID=747365 RepID=M1E775_9BACT|nr:histidinol dehydrogenase [Thermodesulfobium narugense]AEE14335.1 Histidinol dehydrogenase [Thermodesulfobium narugense DSM 14796]